MLLAQNIQEILVRLRQIREQKAIKQDFMADKLNMTRQGYSKIENGISILSVERLLKICEILEVSPIEIIYGEQANQVALEKYNNLYHNLQKLLENDNPTQNP
jgi:transcriptional regulator with XRE-family HTH domain